jgi:hypothetical protein
MLDLPVPSSDSNSGLSFRAFTERIPPIGTQVRIVLEPQLPDKSATKPPITKPATTKTDLKTPDKKPEKKSDKSLDKKSAKTPDKKSTPKED